MKKGITGHMIVCNEEQWVWYAINSVLKYLDQLIIYDTGSTDKTVPIIKSISSSIIYFQEMGHVTATQLVDLRNLQIQKTKTDWFLLLDGDEVWPEDSIAEFALTIRTAPKNLLGIVAKTRVPVGDLYHYQSEEAGNYHLLGQTGHFNLRGYRKRVGFRWQGIYPLEAYCDESGVPLQNKEKQLLLLKHEYWHLTHLIRSSTDTHRKLKLEIGTKLHVDLPEVFFKPHSKIVPSAWVKYSVPQKLIAQIFTPLLHIKRKLLNKST